MVDNHKYINFIIFKTQTNKTHQKGNPDNINGTGKTQTLQYQRANLGWQRLARAHDWREDEAEGTPKPHRRGRTVGVEQASPVGHSEPRQEAIKSRCRRYQLGRCEIISSTYARSQQEQEVATHRSKAWQPIRQHRAHD